MADAQHTPVFAAGKQRGAVGVANAGQKPVMRLSHLLAAIEPVNGAGGGGKQGNVAEKMGRDHVAFDIKRGNSRHGVLVFRICV
ncbi:hypothetical protein C241_24200 [Bradyrhizobium lupini HPC(L)]|uniref:Obg domain-containing protein n=1 Tax=Bradyrhizobium lupini HPC(L) TaxID=1229491 RepID=A0ABP2RKC7_RHILU|nr:hypothetical protein C241_24200 [Bradyrhizobium lupini HPC(L)]